MPKVTEDPALRHFRQDLETRTIKIAIGVAPVQIKERYESNKVWELRGKPSTRHDQLEIKRVSLYRSALTQEWPGV